MWCASLDSPKPRASLRPPQLDDNTAAPSPREPRAFTLHGFGPVAVGVATARRTRSREAYSVSVSPAITARTRRCARASAPRECARSRRLGLDRVGRALTYRNDPPERREPAEPSALSRTAGRSPALSPCAGSRPPRCRRPECSCRADAALGPAASDRFGDRPLDLRERRERDRIVATVLSSRSRVDPRSGSVHAPTRHAAAAGARSLRRHRDGSPSSRRAIPRRRSRRSRSDPERGVARLFVDMITRRGVG